MLVDTIHRISDISAQLCMSISTPQNAILWLIYAIVPDIDYLPGEGDGIRAQNNQLSGTELGGKNNENNIERCDIVQHVAGKGKGCGGGHPDCDIGTHDYSIRHMGRLIRP